MTTLSTLGYCKCIVLILYIGISNAQQNSFGGLQSVNGTNLYVKIIGKGDPLLVIHGGPGLSHSYFLPHLESLSKNFTVILYDQRASGRSAIPSTDSLSLRFFIEDIDALRKQLGFEKINILGHSWGAWLAAQYGIHHPANVKSMILCNAVAMNLDFESEIQKITRQRKTPGDSVQRARIIASVDFKAGKPEAYRKLLALSFKHSFFDPKNISKLNIDIPENYPAASKALFTGLGPDLKSYDLYPALLNLKFPVLILHGKSDIIPLKVSQKAQSVIPGAELLVFDKSGHFIFIEEPVKFREVVTEFIGAGEF